MHEIPDQVVSGAIIAEAPRSENVLERGARPADAMLLRAPSRRIEGVAAPAAPTLAARFRAPRVTFPRAALGAGLIGVVWVLGSHFVGSPPPVAQQEAIQTASVGEVAQKVAAEPPAQKVDLEPTATVPSPAAKDALGVGSVKPSLDPAKTVATREVPAKVEPTRRKPAEKRVDRIGLEISALLAANPGAKAPRSVRKSPHGGRGDAFDPTQNPNAPGAPRPLKAIAPAVANGSAAENVSVRRAD